MLFSSSRACFKSLVKYEQITSIELLSLVELLWILITFISETFINFSLKACLNKCMAVSRENMKVLLCFCSRIIKCQLDSHGLNLGGNRSLVKFAVSDIFLPFFHKITHTKQRNIRNIDAIRRVLKIGNVQAALISYHSLFHTKTTSGLIWNISSSLNKVFLMQKEAIRYT